MSFALHLFLYLACLLGTWASTTHAFEPVPCDPPDLDGLTVLDSIDTTNQPRYPFTTSLGNLDDFTKFIEAPNAEASDADTKQTVFIFLDTIPLLRTTSDQSSDTSGSGEVKKFDPEFHSTIISHHKSAFHEFAWSRRDEPSLKFGIASLPLYGRDDIEGAKAARRTLEEMIQKLGIDFPKPALATVVCLHCTSIPEKTETWVFSADYTPKEAEEALDSGAAEFRAGAEGGDDAQVEKWKKMHGSEQSQWRMVRKKREKEMERWMGVMARPVIGELTEGNLGRVRGTENTIPTIYVLTSSPSQRSHLRRTLFSLATKYHSWLQIVLVDPVLFPDLAKELGVELSASVSDSQEPANDDFVRAAVVWPQKKDNDNNDSRTNPQVQKLIYHYPVDKPITESSIKQWGLDLYLGGVRAWIPSSSNSDEDNTEGKGKNGGDGNGREEKLRVLKEKVHVVKGGKKTSRKVVKRTGSGGIPGVKIRVAGRDEL